MCWKYQSAAFRCGSAEPINLQHVWQPGSLTLCQMCFEGTVGRCFLEPSISNPALATKDNRLSYKKGECTMCDGSRRHPAKQLRSNYHPPQEGSLSQASPLLQSAADTILHCPFSPLTAYMTYFHNINTPTGVDYCITTLQISGELSNKVSQQCCCFITATPKIQNLSGCRSNGGMKKQLFKDGTKVPCSKIPRSDCSPETVAMEMALGEDN